MCTNTVAADGVDRSWPDRYILAITPNLILAIKTGIPVWDPSFVSSFFLGREVALVKQTCIDLLVCIVFSLIEGLLFPHSHSAEQSIWGQTTTVESEVVCMQRSPLTIRYIEMIEHWAAACRSYMCVHKYRMWLILLITADYYSYHYSSLVPSSKCYPTSVGLILLHRATKSRTYYLRTSRPQSLSAVAVNVAVFFVR